MLIKIYKKIIIYIKKYINNKITIINKLKI